MKCPICSVDLVMTDRQGVEIDYCPKCRGIWLDRGELDKIIEKSLVENGANRQEDFNASVQKQSYSDNYSHGHDSDHHGYGGHHNGHRKKGLLGEIFDF